MTMHCRAINNIKCTEVFR